MHGHVRMHGPCGHACWPHGRRGTLHQTSRKHVFHQTVYCCLYSYSTRVDCCLYSAQTSHKHASPSRVARARVALLTNTYQARYPTYFRCGVG